MTIPYKNSDKSKKEQVALMFNNIAHKYDFLNHTLSLGIDTIWRKKAVKELRSLQPQILLDIATGTGDFAIAAARALKPKEIVAVDISQGMMDIGKQKVEAKGLSGCIRFELGDSEALRFADNTFDATLTGFGVRNFENLQLGLKEIYRVLKPGGKAAILEFSMPTKFPVKQLYLFYFKRILPFVGKLFSKDTAAYTYLPDSVQEFPYGSAFAEYATKAGFSHTKIVSLSFGITTLYVCSK